MSRWFVPGLFAALAALAIRRAVGPVEDLLGEGGMRAALIALYFALRACVAIAFAACTLSRPTPRERARDPLAIVACAIAMALVLPVGGPGRDTSTALVFAGDLLAVLSCTWLLASVLALGRCFGVLPEARGLVTRGPYRLVRHPVYLGEIGALLGLTLASADTWMIAVLALFVAAQTVRMGFEERALAAAFPEYHDYAARTARLFPGVQRARTASTAGPLHLGLARPSSSSVERTDGAR